MVAGIALGISFLFPETWFMLFLAWVFLFALARAVQSDDRSVVPGLLVCAVPAHLIGFYWLPQTTTLFGGFPEWMSLLILLLYSVVSSLQFALCGLLYNSLKKSWTQRFSLSLALSWCAAEYLMPKIFPWALAHTQTMWRSFAACAEFGGTALLSLPLFWWASLAARAYRSKRADSAVVSGFVLLIVMICGGWIRNAQIAELLEDAPPYKFALIQGNLSVSRKGDVNSLDANIELYRRLSAESVASGADIVIWPESVASFWTPGELNKLRGTRFDPAPSITVPFIYGGLAYEQRSQAQQQAMLEAVREEVPEEFKRQIRYKYHNSAFALSSEGKLLGRYDKRALMPMGEYLPFERTFPSIRRISPHTGFFDKGRVLEPFKVPMPNGKSLRIMPLICYEDLVPRLSVAAARHGAEVLLNLTNDAWYGDTAAPFQHHLLALWRAIETRRYLVRVTNTGYTAVVDPIGRTTESLPIFTEAALNAEVRPIRLRTLYVFWGDKLVQILTLLVVGGALVLRLRSRKL